MSSEFLSRNRPTNFSIASYGSTSSNQSNRFGQAVIGQEFASNILVADLAMQSTSLNSIPSSSSSPLPPSPPSASSSSSSSPSPSPSPSNQEKGGKKPNRRVTFNLNDIQVQTIPIYSSSSSLSSSISLSSDEGDDYASIEEERVLPSSPPPEAPLHKPSSERISKKASYDALQQRKQIRRRDQSNHMAIKPGYWYPLNPSLRTDADNNRARYSSPLPTLRSLEVTERLINESIQREMALNPNLHNHIAKQTATSSISSSTVGNNRLTTGSDEEQGDGNTKSLFEDEQQINRDEEKNSSFVINDEQPNMRHSPNSFSSVLIDDDNDNDDDDEETDTSVATSSPQPQTEIAVFRQEKEQIETDFSKSVYNELAKRHNQAVIPFPEYQPPKLTFPFEQELIPISAKDGVVVIPPSVDQDPVWIDHPSPAVDQRTSPENKSLFFVKALKAENLDFPIDNDNTYTYCSIRYKNTESRSYDQKMAHTMLIDHEMRIEDIDPSEQITITIHVATSNRKKNSQSNWYHRTKATSDLQRYVHEKDGSICQTLFTPGRFMTEGELDQTASLMLVNNWYKVNTQVSTTSASSNLLKKTSTLMRKRSTTSSPNAVTREKAVGKIYIQCLYIKTHGSYVPHDLDEAVEALNAQRFYNTDWQTGYLTQLGGNAKIPKRHYFTLTGGSLFAYAHDNSRDKRPLYKIPLARATKLMCNNFTIVERPQHQLHSKTPTTLVSQLESVILLNDDEEEGDQDHQEDVLSNRNQDRNIRSDFQLIFDNNEKIQFSCDSAEERNRWVSVIEVMICRLPPLPDWIPSQ